MGVLCLSLFWYTLLCVLSSFAIILKRKRELVTLLLLSYGCLVAVNVLWLFFLESMKVEKRQINGISFLVQEKWPCIQSLNQASMSWDIGKIHTCKIRM